MFRKSLCLLVALLMLLSVGYSLAEGNSASPRYTYTASASAGLDISGGVATVDGAITPWDAMETMVQVRLQQQINGEWKTIQTWTGHRSAGTSDAGGTKSVDYGYNYRTYVKGYVYDGNGNLLESVTVYSNIKAYGTVTP